jgi:phosphoribosyl 1,2-cyclic phosphate phosphodiesterase
MAMKVTFLGTGTSQGVPLIACNCPVCRSESPFDKRLRTSVMVEESGFRLVIDTGPDFRQQMLREQVERLDAVVFTHEHKDHIAGLDDIRAFNFSQNKAMDVYASERVQTALRREFSYIFEDNPYPGIPKINLHSIDGHPFSLGPWSIIPIDVFHYKLPVLGFRIGDFTYITDANAIEDAEKEKIAGSKVLVLNALRRESHISHFTLEQAIALSRELKVEKTYFTHISHQLGLHEAVEKELPEGIWLAYDGLSIML